MNGRYVLIGLTRAPAPWFTELAGWAGSGLVPAEFLPAMSVEEVRAILRTGRQCSAVLVDASVPGWDRDSSALATARGCAVLVVDDDPPRQPWQQLGAHAVISRGLDRNGLLDALRSRARPVEGGEAIAGFPASRVVGPGGNDEGSDEDVRAPGWQGFLIAVTGAAGTGRSTLAMALALGLAADPRDREAVVLADLALHAQQALLHDAGDVVPGLSELVDAFRLQTLGPAAVRDTCFQVPGAGYDLLLGLRRHQDWAALRAHAVEAAVDGLLSTYRVVVADVDADVEGEEESGLPEVEDRNQLARVTLRRAQLVLVVGRAGMAGLHAQLRVVGDLHRLGVPGGCMALVVNQARRAPRRRAEMAATLHQMLHRAVPGLVPPMGPIFVPERRGLDDLVADGGQMPGAVTAPLVGAVRAAREQVVAGQGVEERPRRAIADPVVVAPGSVGRWTQRTGDDAP